MNQYEVILAEYLAMYAKGRLRKIPKIALAELKDYGYIKGDVVTPKGNQFLKDWYAHEGH
ncbi:hypothetical protein ACQXX0_02345 [Corynebacterium diphtheriae]